MRRLLESTTARISLSRMLFRLADQARGSTQEAGSSVCVNLMQDSVEVMLLAIAEHIDASIEQRMGFDKYFVRINEKLAEVDTAIKVLPFKVQLLKLNGMRVMAKHQGITPDRVEVDRAALVCREFLEQCSANIFGESYWTIGPIDILDECEAKTHLVTANLLYREGKFDDCLVECRKAIFIEVESRYSVEEFADGTGPSGIFGAMASEANYIKRNKDWIAENVRTPFDYIQLDHSKVDDALLREGFDVNVFWNLWRLTPAVFRSKSGSEWLIEYDPSKFNRSQIEDTASYALEHTTSFLINRQNHKRGIRTRGTATVLLELRATSLPVLEKAADDSAVIGTTPNGELTIQAMSGTPGLNGKGYYWRVFCVATPTARPYLSGFLPSSDVVDVKVSDF